MIKNLLLVMMAIVTFSFAAEAQIGYYPRPNLPRPYPRPYPNRPLPLPVLPVFPNYPTYPYVYTCNAVGLVNGLIFYGLGNDTITASQRALFVCQSSGQVCQVISCR